MEQNKQQTAVWWLAEQLFKDTTPTLRQRALIEEAKAMEREQTMKAQDFSFREGWGGEQCPTNYYDITYGKE